MSNEKIKNNKKGVFIIPYFGKFKNYFQLFLNSCKYNPDYDWLIFSDDTDKFDYPENVKIIQITFTELIDKINQKFDDNLKLKILSPYKLCDLKPMYGYIFSEYIKNYLWWGYCDTDVIFGNISKFVTDSMLDEYDKIGVLGHFTLIKNQPNITKAFLLPLNGDERFKTILTNKNNFSFDEEGKKSINNIMEEHNYKIYYDLPFAGLYTKTSNFKLTNFDKNWSYSVESKTKNIFVWENGVLKRYSKINNKIIENEYLYIHFQSRDMKVNINETSNKFKIIPNSFDELEVKEITNNFFPKYKHINMHYFKLRSSNLIKKIKKRLDRN